MTPIQCFIMLIFISYSVLDNSKIPLKTRLAYKQA